MNYSTITTYTDKAYGLKRIEFYNSYRKSDLCVPQEAAESIIQKLISEIQKESPEKTVALMTRPAMGRYMDLPEYVLDQMARMPIDATIEFAGVQISRITTNTYNGHVMQRVAITV